MEEKFGISTKKYMCDEVKAKFRDRSNFVIAKYKGLNSHEIEELRKELYKVSSRFLVVKNSVIKRVFKELEISDVEQFIKEEVGVGLMGDVIAAAKTLIDFSKGHNAFKLESAYIDGKIATADKIKQLATLPPREVLIAMAIGRMKAPITGFVGVLGGLLRNFVYAVNEIKKKKEGGEKK